MACAANYFTTICASNKDSGDGPIIVVKNPLAIIRQARKTGERLILVRVGHKIRLPKGKVHTYDFSVDPRVGKETKIVTPKVTAVHRASEDCFFIKVWAEKAVEILPKGWEWKSLRDLWKMSTWGHLDESSQKVIWKYFSEVEIDALENDIFAHPEHMWPTCEGRVQMGRGITARLGI